MRIVLPSEYASESERMFARTPFEAVRDANVHDRVTIRVRQNVNEVILVSHQSSWYGVPPRDSSTSLGMTAKGFISNFQSTRVHRVGFPGRFFPGYCAFRCIATRRFARTSGEAGRVNRYQA